MQLRPVWREARQVAADLLDDDPFQLAAALSYFTLLSLAPLVLIVVAVWVYYAALILFLGAEITKVRSVRRRGKKAPPTEHAVRAAR